MALYAMGDFHLSTTVHKPMDQFDPVWKNHERKIRNNCIQILTKNDTIVITGDHSWGRNLKECREDLAFIEALPGRKILLRGNHDQFWDAKKTSRLNEEFNPRLYFLQNNFYTYKDYALVGTKGICWEGKDTPEHFRAIREREMDRLWESLNQAVKAGYRKYIMFLHYPPTTIGEMHSPFTDLAEQYSVEQVIYSHCHGRGGYGVSFRGKVRGVEYRLVSGDYLKFKPVKILD